MFNAKNGGLVHLPFSGSSESYQFSNFKPKGIRGKITDPPQVDLNYGVNLLQKKGDETATLILPENRNYSFVTFRVLTTEPLLMRIWYIPLAKVVISK